MKKIAVIGGGAAGMMAAIAACSAAPEKDKIKITIYEKNDRLGKKLFITGKGRCNLTNHCDKDTLLRNTVSNPRFLYSAFDAFDSMSTEAFFESLGLKIKTERGNRVFPASDHSSDVISVLHTKIKRLGIEVKLDSEVKNIEIKDNKVSGLTLNGKSYDYDAVIIASGGLSYPLTGSTGDGFKWAKNTGHRVTVPEPALVPMVIKEECCRRLMGLSLKNVKIKLVAEKNPDTGLKKDKIIYEEFGEMLFTHFGVSGPLILSASSYIHKYLNGSLKLFIDLKPALDYNMLDERVLRDFEQFSNKQFQNSLDKLFPKKLIPEIVRCSGIMPEKRVNEITREERHRLVNLIKNFSLTVTGLRGFDEAIITKGGVSVKDINPKTMESKLITGLFFAGEVIDVDSLTGGFNLQIAWSTGYAAGTYAAN